MTKYIPFTAHIRVVPHRANGKRLEYVRDGQKIAVRIYEELEDVASIHIASPGGGQSADVGKTIKGMAFKPQMGQVPAQLMITGFYEYTEIVNNYPQKQVISGGEYQEGYAGSHGWNVNPISAVDTMAKSVKAILETAASSVLGNDDWNIFKLDINGVLYGSGGFHFPR